MLQTTIILSAVLSVVLCLEDRQTIERLKRDDGQTYRITTIEEKPYLEAQGNKFVGFIPDLLEMISDQIKIAYDINLVADGKYGVLERGQWTGMVGELTRNEADIAAAPMTISEERKQAISFTVPFMDVGLSILYLKPKDGEQPPFRNLVDLADHPTMKYGLVRHGLTENFFKNSNNATIRKMWQKMNNQFQDVFTKTIEEGVQKVRSSNGNYVFIIESTTGDYYINLQPCDLATIDISKNAEYGLAVRQASPQLEKLNKAITKLKAENQIQALREKWWKGNCQTDQTSGTQETVMSSLLVLMAAYLVAFL